MDPAQAADRKACAAEPTQTCPLDATRAAGTPGREGDLISAGILLGYSFALDPCGRWAIDAALALGYQHQNYDRYTWYAPAAQSRLLGTRTHDRFTLTALDVALVYRF